MWAPKCATKAIHMPRLLPYATLILYGVLIPTQVHPDSWLLKGYSLFPVQVLILEANQHRDWLGHVKANTSQTKFECQGFPIDFIARTLKMSITPGFWQDPILDSSFLPPKSVNSLCHFVYIKWNKQRQCTRHTSVGPKCGSGLVDVSASRLAVYDR